MGDDTRSLLLAIISGVVASLIVAGIARLAYLWTKDQVHVRRIVKPDDKDIGNYINLYESLFPSSQRTSPTDMVRWLEGYEKERRQPGHHRWKDYYVIAKVGDRTVGICNFMYSIDAKYMYVSYLGIRKTNELGRGLAASKILAYLRSTLAHEFKGCKGIVYETEDPSMAATPREGRRRKARMELFRWYARQRGITMYELSLNYVVPKLDLDPDAHSNEEQMVLNYIPLNGRHYVQMPRDEVLEILRFLYLQVYGDSFDDPAKDAAYREYMDQILDRYTQTLPPNVPVRQ